MSEWLILIFPLIYLLLFLEQLIPALIELSEERKKMKVYSDNAEIQLKINQMIQTYGKEAVLRELQYCIDHEGNVRVNVKDLGYKR